MLQSDSNMKQLNVVVRLLVRTEDTNNHPESDEVLKFCLNFFDQSYVPANSVDEIS